MRRAIFTPGTYLDEGPEGWDAEGALTRRDRLFVDPRRLLGLRGRKGEDRLFAVAPNGDVYKTDGAGQWTLLNPDKE